MKKIFTFLFLLSGFIFAATSPQIGQIAKIEGSVKILKSGSIAKANATVGTKLYAKDIITTSESSKALIKLTNGTTITLAESSKLEISDVETMTQGAGKALYAVQKKYAVNGTKVNTDFATIGVKGTNFIVSSDEKDKRVSLKNGLVELKSLKGEFEIHKQKEADEYEAYMKSIGKEYEKYEETLKKEFIEYKASFEIKPNTTVSFDNNKAYQKKIGEDIEKEFKELESFR